MRKLTSLIAIAIFCHALQATAEILAKVSPSKGDRFSIVLTTDIGASDVLNASGDLELFTDDLGTNLIAPKTSPEPEREVNLPDGTTMKFIPVITQEIQITPNLSQFHRHNIDFGGSSGKEPLTFTVSSRTQPSAGAGHIKLKGSLKITPVGLLETINSKVLPLQDGSVFELADTKLTLIDHAIISSSELPTLGRPAQLTSKAIDVLRIIFSCSPTCPKFSGILNASGSDVSSQGYSSTDKYFTTLIDASVKEFSFSAKMPKKMEPQVIPFDLNVPLTAG